MRARVTKPRTENDSLSERHKPTLQRVKLAVSLISGVLHPPLLLLYNCESVHRPGQGLIDLGLSFTKRCSEIPGYTHIYTSKRQAIGAQKRAQKHINSK